MDLKKDVADFLQSKLDSQIECSIVDFCFPQANSVKANFWISFNVASFTIWIRNRIQLS